MSPLRALDWLGTPLLALGALGLAVAELVRPLRRRSLPRRRRWPTNAALGTIASAVERGAVVGSLVAVGRFAARHRLGLQRCTRLSPAVRTALELLALDAGMYVWHRANHQLPFLWRFHAVHHTDLDLDLSTAARLHPGELSWSILARSAQLLLVGASARTIVTYEAMMQLASLAYHADVDYGAKVDRAAGLVWMTPRLHTRHHAATARERDCNWGVVSSVWDRLFGTFDARPASDPRIGVEGERDPDRLGARRLLALPLP